MQRAVVLVLIAAIVTGCATFLRGAKQTVDVVTNPAGALVSVDGKTSETPAKLTLQRNKAHDVTVTKDGYDGLSFKLKAHWDAGGKSAVIADIVIPGGSVMFLIDTLVGADRRFNDVAPIVLSPSTQPSAKVVQVFERKGKLLTKAQYDQALAADKAPKSKKIAPDKAPSQPPANALTSTDTP